MAFSELSKGFGDREMSLMHDSAITAADFLKALAHEGRLMILCHLASGEKSVTELEELLKYRQAAVSQQLARLRLEGMVTYRRDGKVIYYALNGEKAGRVLTLIYDMFCDPPDGQDIQTDNRRA